MSLRSLTSLRFLAAAMVMLSHLEFLEGNSLAFVAWLAKNVFREGYVGVTFFFALSGFILSYSYADRMASGRTSSSEFLRARVARILPVHLLTILLAVLLPLQLFPERESSSVIFATFAANTALLQAWVPLPDWYFSINAPAWSLSVESFFYLMFPLLIGLNSRILLVSVIGVATIKAGLAFSPAEQDKFWMYIFPPLRIADFAAGILLHRLFVSIGPISNRRATNIQVASIAILLTAALASPLVSQGSRFDLYYLAPMSVLILSFAWQNGRVARTLSAPWLVLLGEASFSLYMIHQLIIRSGRSVMHDMHLAAGGRLEIALSIVFVLVSIAISITMFRLYEVPAKNWVMGILAKKSAHPKLQIDLPDESEPVVATPRT